MKRLLLVQATVVGLAVLNMAPSGCEGSVSPPEDGAAGTDGDTHGGSSGGDSHGHAGSGGSDSHGSGGSDSHGSGGSDSHAGSAGTASHGGSSGGAHTGDWPPWPNYYEEYPVEYRHMLYDPSVHHGGGHGDDPADDCHANPPTHEQIRAANDFAVKVAMTLDTFPVFPDQASFDIPDYIFFGVPGSNVGGYHYFNWRYTGDDQVLNPERIEYAIYSESPTGFRPVGAMFLAEPYGVNTQLPGPDFGGCITHWHNHDEFGLNGYMIHVWTYGLETGPYSEPPDECLNIANCL